MIERNPPEIGQVTNLTFRRVHESGTVLRDVHEGFEFKTLYYIPNGELMPKKGDFVYDFLNLGDYGMFDYHEPYTGKVKPRVRLNDPTNVWLGFDYDTAVTFYLGPFKKDSNIWEN